MLMSELAAAEPDFGKRLLQKRATVSGVNWYPYSSLTGIPILASFIPPNTELVSKGGSVLDVGAADGDIGFLMHELGCKVDFLDNGPTNYNQCQGLRKTSPLVGHTGTVIEKDIDMGFELASEYDMAIFLGILYHLRNPALALIRLAQRCRRMLISTRVATHLPDSQDVSNSSVAYLLDKRECNGDPTNYWIFSPFGLKRFLKRCGWNVTHVHRVGAVGKSNPVDGAADERMFALCERVSNHADLDKHHDF